MMKSSPFLVGVGLGLGLIFGYFVGYTRGNEFSRVVFRSLWDLPVGEVSYTVDPPAVWQKTGPRILAYRPIADPTQAKVAKLFSGESVTVTTVPTSSVTSTTVVKKEK